MGHARTRSTTRVAFTNAGFLHGCETEPPDYAIVPGMNVTTTESTSTPNDNDTTPATATRWTLDAGHSAVGFSVRHLMITNVRGEFEEFRGEVVYDAAHPEATRIEATSTSRR